MYVLFKEINHQEAMLEKVRLGDNTVVQTKNPYRALTFETARQAYAFGANHKLPYWRVRKLTNFFQVPKGVDDLRDVDD